MADDDIEMRFEFVVAREQVVKIAIQKAVRPNTLEHQMQVEPHVFHRARRVGNFTRREIHRFLKFGKQVMDDLVLVTKMIVEIARADVEFIGDMAGGDIGLALMIEKFKTHPEDALAGARRAGRRWRLR